MDLYNDKARYDSFLNEQNNIESGFREQQENYSNQLQNAKLSATENKQIGSEMFFSSMPQAMIEGQQIYTKIKGVYDTAQKVAQQAQKIKDGVSDAVSNIKTKAQGVIDDVKSNVQGAVDGVSSGIIDSPETTINAKRADLINKANEYHDELNPVFPELGENERQMDLDEVNNASDSKIVSMHQEAGLTTNDIPMADPSNIPTSLREVQFDNPLFQGGSESSVAETFGNVKNYIGGQVGDLGTRVSVLPNMETSIGSLKQAMPKVPTMENIGGADLAGSEANQIVGGLKQGASDALSDAGKVAGDVANQGTNLISNVSNIASDVGGDILKKGAGLLEESSIPIVGDVLAGVGLVSSLYEGIKGLVDKPEAPPPPPPVDVPSTVVQQAGI